MTSYQEVTSRVDDLFNIKDYKQWDKEVLRKEVLSRLHNLKLRKMKAWFPTTSVEYDDPKDVCCDKFGGSYPYFSKFDREWPKCQKCSALMKFIFQVSDPSNINMFGTIQVFLCPEDYHYTMSDGVDHGFFIRNVDYTVPYQYIPQPASVKAYKGFKITSWQPAWETYIDDEYVLHDIILNSGVIDYLDLEEEVEQIITAEVEDPDSEEVESGMKWYGRVWSCQDITRYSPFSFQWGTVSNFKYGDCGVLHAMYKKGELVVTGDMS